MNILKKTILPILLSTIWISICEFVRNQFLLMSYWVDHYKSIGLIFPSEPINGAIWGLWALVISILIYFISKKFTVMQAAILMWFNGWVLMWLVIGNLGVLPVKILFVAVPFSLFEAFGAVWLTKKFSLNDRS